MKPWDPVAVYEQSAESGAPVPPPPELMVRLFQEVSGRPFDAALWATYERIRAHMAYQGIKSAILAPASRPAPVPPTPRRVGMIDPTDLGDD